MNRSKHTRYEAILLGLFDRFERILCMALFLLFVALLLTQTALQFEPVRHMVTLVDRLEGSAF